MALSITTATLFGALCCIWICWLWNRRQFYKFGLQFPTVWGLPLLGVFLQVGYVDNLIPYISDFWTRIKQRTVLVWLSITPIIITVDPKVVEQVLTKTEFAEKSPILYNPVQDALKGGMIALSGKESQRRRKIFAPTLRHKQLVGLMPIFNSKSKEFLAILEGHCQAGGEHEMLNTLRIFSFTISKETTMGYTKYKEPQVVNIVIKRLLATFRYVFFEMILNCAHLRFLIRLNPILHWHRKKLYAFGNEIFNYRSQTVKIDNPLEVDCSDREDMKNEPLIFIDQALKYHKAGQLSWDEIIGEANAILVASFETTSSTVYSTLVLLAMHQEIQTRLYEEILDAFPNNNFNVCYEDFKNLTYLEMVISEAMRLFPAAPLLARDVSKEATLVVDGRDYTVPAHMQIVIDVFNIQREPVVWGPQANAFNPDNFLPHRVADRSAYAFLAFSKGARNCVGWNYAHFSMKIFLAHILRNYSVHTTFRYEDIKVKSTFFLEYSVEPFLSFQRRF